MKTPRWSSALGWASTVGVLGSYLLLSAGALAPGALYFGASGAASVLMVAHGIERRAWPVALLNAAWAAISAVGMWRAL